MRLLFISLLDFNSFNDRNIYTDLLREFIRHGHDVYCISPVERRKRVNTHMEEDGHLLKLKIGNTQKTNIIEKGISTLLIEPLFKQAIKKYFSDIKFDLISTRFWQRVSTTGAHGMKLRRRSPVSISPTTTTEMSSLTNHQTARLATNGMPALYCP